MKSVDRALDLQHEGHGGVEIFTPREKSNVDKAIARIDKELEALDNHRGIYLKDLLELERRRNKNQLRMESIGKHRERYFIEAEIFKTQMDVDKYTKQIEPLKEIKDILQNKEE